VAFSGCGDSSSRVVDPPESPALDEALGAPNGVSHTGSYSGDVLRWGVPTESSTTRTVAGYNLYLYDPNPETGEAYRRVNSSPLTARSYVFTGLTPGEPCYVRIRAIDSEGAEGNWSVALRFVPLGVGGDRPGHLGQTEGTVYDGSGEQL
jgi:hypothetical protein